MTDDNINYLDTAFEVSGEEEFVFVPLERYNDLLETEAYADALDATGVENWEGYDEAMRIYDQFNIEEEDELPF